MVNQLNTKGGKSARIGVRFFDAVQEIIDQRLKNGSSKDRVSVEKLTNMIVRHRLFIEIAEELKEVEEEVINTYGK